MNQMIYFIYLLLVLHVILISSLQPHRYSSPLPKEHQVRGNSKSCFSCLHAANNERQYNNGKMEIVNLFQYVQTADIITIIPSSSLNFDDISSLRKLLPQHYNTLLETKANLLIAFNGTPFCQISEDNIPNSAFCIFMKDSDENGREFIRKWIRQISKTRTYDFPLIFCTKSYCAKINVNL